MNDGILFPVKVELTGDLKLRAELLQKRLHSPDHYAPSDIFRPADYEWPGDYEGRAILAWSLLERFLPCGISKELRQVIAELPKHLNEKGYFGKIYLPELADEQQLSGHGWLLRGLTEYYITSGDENVAPIVKRILEELVIPLNGRYERYPINEALRKEKGEAIGKRGRQIQNWVVSTDIGCAFILTDGVIQASEVFNIDCSSLIEEMIRKFEEIDLLAIKAQTHATLSFTRGLLRYYAQKGFQLAFNLAKRNYALYREHGMCEHFANFNWFLRPETWTEPCAIIDSYMIAMELYRCTGETDYLDDAHRIWFSGIERSQRDNGGMGLDNCPTSDEPFLHPYHYEAHWCCTMRGGEGFYERAMHSMWQIDDALEIAIPTPGIFNFAGGLSIEITTDYPEGTSFEIRTLKAGANPPQKIKTYFAPGGIRKSLHGNGVTVWQGPVLCGRNGEGEFVKINQAWKHNESSLTSLKLKVLFGANEEILHS